MSRQGSRILLAGLMASLATTGAGASPASARVPRHLWATVNICDTAAYPNGLGVRASMPGDRRARRMYMRFHAQYYDSTSGRWFDVSGGVTRWRYVARARVRWAQSGYTFRIGLAPGATLVTRGQVDFQWRTRRLTPSGPRWVPVRTRHAYTRGGHPNTRGADPPGYSSALCEIHG